MFFKKHSFQLAFTLVAAWASAELFVWLHTPIPWMLGPLIGIAALSMMEAPVTGSAVLRDTAQWVIGGSLGLYFTPDIGRQVVGLWWAIALAAVWALVLGGLFAWWLYRTNKRQLPEVPDDSLRATAFFAAAIGGASEMTLLADRAGARSDLVAASHSLRLLVVVVVVPFAMLWARSHWGLQAVDLGAPLARVWGAEGLLKLVLASGAGALLARWLKVPNPWFLGPMFATMGLTLAGVYWSAVPQVLINGAQLVVGLTLGAKFSRRFLRMAPVWLGTVLLGTVLMLVLCGVFGWVMAQAMHIHPATAILGTVPGGITEMAITAKVLQLGVPVVTALQACRLVAVLVLIQPLYRWALGRTRL